jgi:hypothetical protein
VLGEEEKKQVGEKEGATKSNRQWGQAMPAAGGGGRCSQKRREQKGMSKKGRE